MLLYYNNHSELPAVVGNNHRYQRQQAGRFVDQAILIIIRSRKQQQQQQHGGGSCWLWREGKNQIFFSLSFFSNHYPVVQISEPQRRQLQLVVVVACNTATLRGQVEVELEQDTAGRRGGGVRAIVVYHGGRGPAVAMAVVAVEDWRRRRARREYRPHPRTAEGLDGGAHAAAGWPGRRGGDRRRDSGGGGSGDGVGRVAGW